MTVLEYRDGEHGGGFVGFRVVRTIGSADEYRQRYFSLGSYSYRRARKLAYELDARWKEEAEQNRVLNKIHRKTKRSSKLHILAVGLKAWIDVEQKQRGGVERVYFVPCFKVKIPGVRKPDKVFRIRKLGYRAAWIQAVMVYSEIHGIPSGEQLALMARRPDKELFTGYLLQRLCRRGYTLSKSKLEKMLDSAESQSR